MASKESSASYGGNFAWVDMPYKMKIDSGIAPLQWLNALTKRLLALEDMVFAADGTFHRPGESNPMFPCGGIDLRWRWDDIQCRVIINFWNDGKFQDFRWDELQPAKELRFPSIAPDFLGIGHVGRFSFTYQLVSAAFAPPQRTPVSDAVDFSPIAIPSLPGKLACKPKDKYDTAPQANLDARRDFARLISKDPQVFLMCPSFSVPQPLCSPDGASGDWSDEAVDVVIRKFQAQVQATLQSVGEPELPDHVFHEIISYAAVGRGIDFATQQDLLPIFLQPSYIIVCFGEPWQVRLLAYGYVAGKPLDISGDRPANKSTPFLARLVSPELALQADSSRDTTYEASNARSTSMVECMASDSALLHEVVASCRWEGIL